MSGDYYYGKLFEDVYDAEIRAVDHSVARDRAVEAVRVAVLQREGARQLELTLLRDYTQIQHRTTCAKCEAVVQLWMNLGLSGYQGKLVEFVDGRAQWHVCHRDLSDTQDRGYRSDRTL